MTNILSRRGSSRCCGLDAGRAQGAVPFQLDGGLNRKDDTIIDEAIVTTVWRQSSWWYFRELLR